LKLGLIFLLELKFVVVFALIEEFDENLLGEKVLAQLILFL
jgi:hypothetical protein